MTEPQAWPIEAMVKHGNTYEVKLVGLEPEFFTADELAAAGITPPPDPINFDTMPVGTVLRHKTVRSVVVRLPEGWINATSGWEDTPTMPNEWTVVHVPDAPSVRTALHTIGLTDDDIAYVDENWFFAEGGPTGKVVAAARAAENERKADAARLLRTPDTPTDSDTAARARARALLDAYPEDVFPPPQQGWRASMVTGWVPDSNAEDGIRDVWIRHDVFAAHTLRTIALPVISDLFAEVDRLTRWKAEATEVIGAWEAVDEALGCPAELGESRAAASEREALALRAERDAAVARAEQLEAAIGKHLNDHADERGEQFGCCNDDEALWSAAFDRGTDR